MCNFKTIVPEEAKLNPFLTLKNEWGLLTAGTFEDFNMMTIAWGYFGIMWNKPVFGAVVRPNRYTYEFMEKNSTFTVSFFPPEFRRNLSSAVQNRAEMSTKCSRPVSSRLTTTDLSIFHRRISSLSAESSVFRILTRKILLTLR
jgi:flavin reductase (DIM6/NTAB) family NADH-FMN oxidoreductase RutF